MNLNPFKFSKNGKKKKETETYSEEDYQAAKQTRTLGLEKLRKLNRSLDSHIERAKSKNLGVENG